MSNFVVNTMPADGLTQLGAKISPKLNTDHVWMPHMSVWEQFYKYQHMEI